MPDPWVEWDERVKRTGRPSRVCEDLNDLELLILLSDDNPERAWEKQLIRQEAYRRMGHPDAAPPEGVAMDAPRREADARERMAGMTGPSPHGEGVERRGPH